MCKRCKIISAVPLNWSNLTFRESSDEAVSEARDFVKRILELNSEIVKPIVTPRFALSCTESLMGSLAKIAKENNVNIQVKVILCQILQT